MVTFQVAVFVCGNNGRLLLRIVVVEIEYDRIGVVGEFDIEVVAAAVNLEFALGEVLLIDVFGFVAFERRHFERLGHLLVIAVGSFDDRNDHISGIVVEVFEQNLLRRGGLHLVARGEDVVFVGQNEIFGLLEIAVAALGGIGGSDRERKRALGPLALGERHLHRSALIDFLGRQRDRFRQDGGVLPCRSGRQYDILGFGFEFFHLDKLRLDLFELPALGHDGNSVGQFDPFDIFQTDIGAFVRILRCDSEADRTCRRRTGRHDDGYLRLSIFPPPRRDRWRCCRHRCKQRNQALRRRAPSMRMKQIDSSYNQ